MEAVLALHGIQVVQLVTTSGGLRYYAFSDKMVTNNVLIEYFWGEEEGEDEDSEPGGQLSIILRQGDNDYQLLLFHGSHELGVPVMMLQTILFLVGLIEKAYPTQFVEYFRSISPDPLIPHEIEDKKFRTAANKMLTLKIQAIQELIRRDNANLN